MRKTKIVCTLGPASASAEVMEKMLKAGMNVARLNFSHGDHEGHGKTIDTFRKVRDSLCIPAAVMLDTKGPEIRTGNFEGGKAELEDGQIFTLTTEHVNGNSSISAVTYKELPRELKTGDYVLIDDGKIRLQVIETTDTEVKCKVKHGGTVSNHKGINIPNVALKMEYLSEKDKEDLIFGIEKDVDYVAASFVRKAEDVGLLRGFLDAHGGKDIKIISKIENLEGIENFEEILELSDGIIVARGDMGVEVDFERLPGIQKRIIRQCNSQGKIVITATQMLDSMMERPMPTRAEITDVANAVFDGSSGVMLSGETAAGKYPALTVETMSRIVLQAEKDTDYRMKGEEFHHESIGTGNPAHALGHAACTMADDIGAKALAAVTASGHTARMMAKFRPVQPIIGVTPYVNVYHSMSLIWGVIPVMDTTEEDWALLRQTALNAVRRLGIAETGDYVISSAGIPFNIKGNTNILRVDKII